MDEEPKIVLDKELPWEIEAIDDNQVVYRHILASQRTGSRPKRYPSEGHFSLREEEDSLSFNWGKYIDESKNFKLLSISANKKGELINYTGFQLFKYAVSALKTVDKFEKIIHSPNYSKNPSDVGNPNNKSHASLFYDVNDNGVRVALSDYCCDNYEFSYCAIELNALKEEIDELRLRENDTPYHKLWEFDD